MTDPDPADLDEYRAFLDKSGRAPTQFQLDASPADPSEGALGPSRRTVTVRHTPTGHASTYGLRTWVEDFKADVAAGVFDP